MAVTLQIEDELVGDAVKIGGHHDESEAVTAALREYVRSRRRRDLRAMIGTVEYDEAHDYKADRRREAERGDPAGVSA